VQVLCPFATFTPAASVNVGGALDVSKVRLFVVHIAQGNSQSGIDAWFADPRAEVSAHFSISRTGQIHQHVPLDRMAWAESGYNDVAWSIEHCGYSGGRLSAPELRSSLHLLRWLHEQRPEVPLHRTSDPNGTGVIGHGELGVLGGDHPDCPGTPVLYQFNIALRTAKPAQRHWHLPKRF
jgi:hypothetical protein